jgi:hypothetical protein
MDIVRSGQYRSQDETCLLPPLGNVIAVSSHSNLCCVDTTFHYSVTDSAFMASKDVTPSPASRNLASKISKYAYSPTSPSSPTAKPSRNVAMRAGPSAPSPLKQSRGIKREYLEGEDYTDQPSPSKKAKPSTPGKKARPFAGPEVYAHLQPVTDHLKPDLDSESPSHTFRFVLRLIYRCIVIFCGIK